MFARSAAIALLALPILASATNPSGGVNNSCNTGSLQCCNDVQDSKSLSNVATGLLGLLHIDIGALTGKVGVTCNPITVIGVSGTSCSAQPTCCTNNSFKGVVAIGCTPVNVNV